MPVFDPLEQSRNYLAVLVFFFGKSPAYQAAVELAETADHYEKATVGKLVRHTAAFDRSRRSSMRVTELIRLIAGWRGAEMYSAGRAVQALDLDRFQLQGTLSCYADSFSVNDKAAYCRMVETDPRMKSKEMEDPLERLPVVLSQFGAKPYYRPVLFPCRRLFPMFQGDYGHPSSMPEMIRSQGRTTGCDICPLFDPDAFRDLPPDPRR